MHLLSFLSHSEGNRPPACLPSTHLCNSFEAEQFSGLYLWRKQTFLLNSRNEITFPSEKRKKEKWNRSQEILYISSQPSAAAGFLPTGFFFAWTSSTASSDLRPRVQFHSTHFSRAFGRGARECFANVEMLRIRCECCSSGSELCARFHMQQEFY